MELFRVLFIIIVSLDSSVVDLLATDSTRKRKICYKSARVLTKSRTTVTTLTLRLLERSYKALGKRMKRQSSGTLDDSLTKKDKVSSEPLHPWLSETTTTSTEPFSATAQELPKVTIYTDGACSGNPGPGGWGAVLLHGDVSKEIFGHEVNTTNNRMEMKAAINALTALRRRCHVVIYTDSKYLQLGITDWIKKWMKNNWVNSKKQPVKNIELWQAISRLLDRHRVDWNWVKAHNNDEYNERADRLAVRGRDIASSEQKKKR